MLFFFFSLFLFFLFSYFFFIFVAFINNQRSTISVVYNWKEEKKNTLHVYTTTLFSLDFVFISFSVVVFVLLMKIFQQQKHIKSGIWNTQKKIVTVLVNKINNNNKNQKQKQNRINSTVIKQLQGDGDRENMSIIKLRHYLTYD